MTATSNTAAIAVGDTVEVVAGTMDILRSFGFVGDFMTESIDGKIGTVVADFREAVGFPHLAVELGFSQPVGIPESFLLSR